MLLSIHAAHPEPRKIARAIDVLQSGGVVAYPTDTIYGLGCDILEKRGIQKIYRIKRMEEQHPLTLVCPDLSDIAKYAIVDDRAYRLMRRLLPGAYTFLLPATREVPRLFVRKRKTVGIRVPHHPVAIALVRALGRPIASSSATFEGEALCDPHEIKDKFSGIDLILDGGVGGLVASTVVDLASDAPTILREGAGSVSALS